MYSGGNSGSMQVGTCISENYFHVENTLCRVELLGPGGSIYIEISYISEVC